MITDPKKRDVALVVDDSPETLRLLTDALDGAGMTVMVALDGASAMRIVDQITPDIVLLDAVMPGMDGFETCKRRRLRDQANRDRGDAGADPCSPSQRAADTKRTRRTRCLRPLSPRSEQRWQDHVGDTTSAKIIVGYARG
jgi:CheY-like chemotaxis protein